MRFAHTHYLSINRTRSSFAGIAGRAIIRHVCKNISLPMKRADVLREALRCMFCFCHDIKGTWQIIVQREEIAKPSVWLGQICNPVFLHITGLQIRINFVANRADWRTDTKTSLLYLWIAQVAGQVSVGSGMGVTTTQIFGATHVCSVLFSFCFSFSFFVGFTAHKSNANCPAAFPWTRMRRCSDHKIYPLT